jgi:peptidoglycan/LPS O-acetylase OafA/YrhL
VRPVRSALDARPTQWLGRVSFSLYLVHMPILATLTFVLGDDRWWLVAILTLPLALLAAWGFNRIVERPSHRLARAITGAVSARLEAHRGHRVPPGP